MATLQIRSSPNFILKQALIGLFYAVFAFLPLHYFSFLNFVTLPNLASGFALSAVLIWGPQIIIGIALGSILALMLIGLPIFVTIAFIVGASSQALLGFYLFNSYCKKNKSGIRLDSVNDYFFLIVVVCVIGTVIRPLCVSVALLYSGVISPDLFFIRFSSLWLSDALGCILIVPMCLIRTPRDQLLPIQKIVPVGALILASIFVGHIVFFGRFQQELGVIARSYWMFLFVSLIAIMSDVRLTSFLLFFLSVQAFSGTISGFGPFGMDAQGTGMISVAFYCSILSIVGMFIALFAREPENSKIALLESMRDLQLKGQALDAISQGVLIADGNRRTTYVNRAFQELTGYSAVELIGGSCSVLQGVESSKETIAKLKENLNTKLSYFGEILNYRKDGTTFWNELSISPVRDDSGEVSQFVGVQHDITKRKMAESMAKLSSKVFDHNPNAILITDAEKNILLVNKKFTEITGYELGEVVGQGPKILNSGTHDANFYSDMWQIIVAKGQWEGEIWNQRKNGEIYPEWLQIISVLDNLGDVTNYIGMFSDLTESKKAEQNINRLENFDALTGLPNLASMQTHGERALSAARSRQSNLSVLFIDLDNFKYVNDTVGHQIGDLLLIETAARFQAVLREGDVLSRQGGDEFVILLPVASESGAAHVARKIIDEVARPFYIGTHTLNITASVGIVLYPQDGESFDDLSRCADIALFHAKEQGRNNFQFYATKMSDNVMARVRLEAALHIALTKDEFDLHYQALTDMQSGKITGFEALIRWTHPELGQINPAYFIPIAEECGVINAIGAWVLDRACRDIRCWMDTGLIVPTVAINFSPRQFRNPNLILHIQDALDRYKLLPNALCIEITEGVLMEDAHVSRLSLDALKRLGLTLSLDDFGTGYSSLSYLKLFPFDKVKIDQSFVREITSNNQDAAIVIAIIGMAHSLGIKVLAEGVETEAQCDFLRNNMTDEIQGYFFSKPISANDAEVMIREDRRLPSHLLRLSKPEKTLLLVDDEQNIVSSLKRLLRKDGYKILTANSGQEGLDILIENKVDVIVSDQRMPGMTGVEFLRNVKSLYPDTIRIVLSGYTELNSVTDAINEGAVFRFLTKPWDDEKLRDHIKEAFNYKELSDDNRLLAFKVQTSNLELAAANRQLAEGLLQKQNQHKRDALSLSIVREALQYAPVAVIGVDDGNVIAFANDAAVELLSSVGMMLGEELNLLFPELDKAISNSKESADIAFEINKNSYHVRWRHMGAASESIGKVIIISGMEKDQNTIRI